MRLVSRDEIIFEKFKRRSSMPFLETSANGDLIHIGKVSRGCRGCFVKNDDNGLMAVYTGCECNVECGYCYYDKKRDDKKWDTLNSDIIPSLVTMYEIAKRKDFTLKELSYNSNGETLKYMDVVRETARLKKEKESSTGDKTYSFLYTNGTLATKDILKELRDLEIDELRFHLSASNYSKKVFESLEYAKKLGFIITVEEPSLPKEKDKIIGLLSYFDSIGLNHLDLVECQVTPFNFEFLDKEYPDGRYYQDTLWHLYDEGLVYDVMQEVYDKKYNYSVIDCNSKVETSRARIDAPIAKRDYETRKESLEQALASFE